MCEPNRSILVGIGSYALRKTKATRTRDWPRAYEQMATENHEFHPKEFNFFRSAK